MNDRQSVLGAIFSKGDLDELQRANVSCFCDRHIYIRFRFHGIRVTISDDLVLHAAQGDFREVSYSFGVHDAACGASHQDRDERS
jgi:hypothetical protein